MGGRFTAASVLLISFIAACAASRVRAGRSLSQGDDSSCMRADSRSMQAYPTRAPSKSRPCMFICMHARGTLYALHALIITCTLMQSMHTSDVCTYCLYLSIAVCRLLVVGGARTDRTDSAIRIHLPKAYHFSFYPVPRQPRCSMCLVPCE